MRFDSVPDHHILKSIAFTIINHPRRATAANMVFIAAKQLAIAMTNATSVLQ